MHLLPTPEQRELRSAVRAICESEFPAERLGAEASTLDRGLWRRLGEMGLFALRLPEVDGGVGLGTAEAVLAFEELGRALVPGPLVATHLATPYLPGAATGERLAGIVDLREAPLLVEHHADLDDLLLLDGDRLLRADPAAVPARPVERPLDPWTPVSVAAAPPDGEPVAQGPAVAALRRDGALLTAALQVGIAAAVLDRAVRYVGEREQFGRPVGAFQAVKHAAADMLVRLELARSAVWAAAATCDAPEAGDPDRAVAAAKLLAGEAATKNSLAAVQLHGGMGFAWEVDVHFFLKRSWLHDTCWGDADTHAEALAAAL
ncbi:acyl-CoA dehydrogenase family protein [Phytohabitans sp. ZYX-F-186]|uniref:Acyl-CoA dehydrogenase family protein n=1 Tax=Phytohabitans maris TaxID=3071409 RepID=A0ABU0Z9M0_9ACTN|nr:acyl-CoA dehydrogenase family protein [Phytohabitans sp. ZYX-F-186]MDQ7903738.1 acyl-CoA dehydrogenase family protein [Phytohabitans sp. ZYX-F-186]